MRLGIVTGALLFCAPAVAEEHPARFYEIVLRAPPPKAKAGETVKLGVEIKTKGGAHISEEAPLKVEPQESAQFKPDKAKLSWPESLAKKAPGQEHVDPKFEIAYQARASGSSKTEAKLTFFVCTEKICARQQKTVSANVEVE